MAKVYLMAGHGGADPGALGYGMKEKDITLVMTLACEKELKRHGMNVVMGRRTDTELTLAEEVAGANNSDADVAVAIHVNAAGGDGFEVYYFSGSEDGRRLAALGEKYVTELGQNSRGLKSGDHLYFIRNTAMPAVLYEAFFIDNDTDNNIGDTVEKQQRFGTAYAKAILEYFGMAYLEDNGAAAPEEDDENEDEPVTLRTRTFQNWLRSEFGYDIEADGMFGAKTDQAAVQAFQKLIGTAADGIWGEDSKRSCPVLGAGDKGTQVKWLQGYMGSKLGYHEVIADGDFGEITEKSVIDFQRKIGLIADGLAGADTITAMINQAAVFK